MSIRSIPRIKSRRIKNFIKEYVGPQKPVIITDLYEGQKISQLETESKVRKYLGDMELYLRVNSYETHFTQAPGRYDMYRMTLADYFDQIEREPNLQIMCPEQGINKKMKLLFKVPELAKMHAPWAGTNSLMYVSRGGLAAPLHFDSDHRQILFTMVTGRKRIYLIHPNLSARFLPAYNFAGVAVHKFEEKEKQHFFGVNDAYECVLEPGETLLIPKCWWHYLENIGTTLAFNVRFHATLFDHRMMPLAPNYKLACLSTALVDPVKNTLKNQAVYEGLFENYYAHYSTPEKRREIYEAYLSEEFEKHCKDAVKVIYGHPHLNPIDENFYYNIHSWGRGPLTDVPGTKADYEVLFETIKKTRATEQHLQNVLAFLGIGNALGAMTRLECRLVVNELLKPEITLEERAAA